MSEEKTLPGHDMQPQDITCSSCGRFVGALSRCPHCGARVNKRLSVRATRYAALLLAFIGLGLLYWMSVTRKLPVIQVGDITPTMNFAYVQVHGEVTRDARVFKEGGRITSMSFEINDGTGDLPCMAYRAQAQELIAAGKVPRLGDKITVAGSLAVQADDRVTLRIQVADQVEIEQADLPQVPLGEIDPDVHITGVIAEGVITKIYAPQPGKKQPWSLKISDDTGTGSLSFWEDVYAGIEEKDKLVEGQAVRVRASVNTYRGKTQLRLNRGADIEFIDVGELDGKPTAQTRSLEALTVEEIKPELKGRTVETEGEIIGFYEPEEGSKAPSRIMLEDGTATVTVIYWDKVAEALGERKPEKGTRMQVRGKVDEFKGKMQLVVNYADQMEFYQPPPSRALPVPESVDISTITAENDGERLTVSGVLGKARSIKSGIIYPLRDKTGSILLLLWDRNVPGEARDDLKPGIKVTVTGDIKLYKGDLEIIPANANAIHLK
jgi:DNA/RNA endonuclease YhcR with UshA esterase domain